MARSKRQIEFGDFQTPEALAERVCAFLALDGFRPASLVEPTCGMGAFLFAAMRQFPHAEVALGLDINAEYLATTRRRITETRPSSRVELIQADFFDFDWPGTLVALPQPILVVGNPPWVTASRMGSLTGTNVPAKSNFMGLAGMAAKTGRSNFDVSEWVVIRLLEWARKSDVMFALLLKTSVARRVLAYAWDRSIPIAGARLLRIDTMEVFGASADAGLLIFRTAAHETEKICRVSEESDWGGKRTGFGMRGKNLVADAEAYDRTSEFVCGHPVHESLRWRSGIKHDCARILELTQKNGRLYNGLGEVVDVEGEWVFPLLKGSAVAAGRRWNKQAPRRYVIVTQRTPGDDTYLLENAAPRLWAYLNDHKTSFEDRRSSIYRGRPPFSVFGVGSYTFRLSKVAICGLYKRFTFTCIESEDGRPVLLDDTAYHLSFDTESDASLVLELLNSDVAREFLAARVFWDAKRPITAELLQQLDLVRLAERLGRIDEWQGLADRMPLFQQAASQTS